MIIEYGEELFSIPACLTKVHPRDKQHRDLYPRIVVTRQEMGLALRDQPRPGNEISECGAHVRNRKRAPRRPDAGTTVIYLDARHLTYVPDINLLFVSTTTVITF